MPRVRPTEHRAVVKLLNEPAESVEDLAAEVIIALDEARSKRQDFVTVVQHAPGFVMVYGPYVTRNAAERDVGKSIIASREGAQYMVLPINNHIDEGIEGVD